MSEYVVLGVVAGAHGIGGELRVHPHNPDSPTLARAGSVLVRDASGAVRRRAVQRSRRHKGAFLLKLEGVDDRDAADACRGREIVVERGALAETGADEFYYHDLIGSEAVLEGGGTLGVIEEIFDAGAHAVLVVRGERRERLIPFTEDAIAAVSPGARTVTVRRQPGLLD